MNTIHWAAQRETEITLRPKSLTPDQYPLTPQQSLEMLYGVGLATNTVVLDAEALRLGAVGNHDNALLDVALGKLRLQRVIGEL